MVLKIFAFVSNYLVMLFAFLWSRKNVQLSVPLYMPSRWKCTSFKVGNWIKDLRCYTNRNDWFKFYELLLAVPSCERLCQIKAVQAEMNFTEWVSLHLNWTFFRHSLFALSSVFLVATIFCGNCLRANVSAPRRARVHSEFIIIWSVVYTSTIHHL